MGEWAKVVTQPLGLAGFALFLIFGYLAKVEKPNILRWLSPVGVVLAAGALVGGLALAYLQSPKPTPPTPQNTGSLVSSGQETNQVISLLNLPWSIYR